MAGDGVTLAEGVVVALALLLGGAAMTLEGIIHPLAVAAMLALASAALLVAVAHGGGWAP